MIIIIILIMIIIDHKKFLVIRHIHGFPVILIESRIEYFLSCPHLLFGLC